MASRIPVIRPKKLRPGAKIGVPAPAGPVDAKELRRGLAVLRRMGFKPVLGRFVMERDRFLAGADERRAEDLRAMFQNPEIDAIVCARGGYGVNRILPWLDHMAIKSNPKIVVGASDITLLLVYLRQVCSLTVFHGPMVAGSFGRHAMKRSKTQFRQLLTGQAAGRRLRAPGAVTLRPGVATAPLTGGCMTLLCRSLGTPYEITTRGHILFLEDVNERPYRIDGMLWQLWQAGKFSGVKGVVFGEMIGCHPDPAEGYKLWMMIAGFFRDVSFPVLANCPIGHGGEMWTLPLGVEAALDANAKTLTLDGCGVV